MTDYDLRTRKALRRVVLLEYGCGPDTLRRRKICLIFWRTRQNENAPDRKKPVRGIWGCCKGQGQCLRSYFRRSRSSSRERCFSPWRSLG